jgi:hypothetical protein
MEANMEWTQFIIFFLGVFGLFIWNRTESRADIRHMDNKIDAIRELMHAIHIEMKDFHNRLCKIESEKNK